MVQAMRTRTLAATLPLLAAVLLAACGGGGDGVDGGVASLGGDAKDGDTTSTTLSEEEAEEALLDWAACMRGEGLDVPDPQIDGEGRVRIGVGSGGGGDDEDEDGGTDGGGTPPDRDAMEAAFEECGEPPSVGSPPSEQELAEMQENALEMAQCMRDEGIEDFPDPDFSDMGPGAGPGTRTERFNDDDDEASDDDGSSEVVAGPFGVVDLDDPEMRAAFETCSEANGFGRPDGEGEPAAATSSKSS